MRTWSTRTIGELIDVFDSMRVPLSGAERSKRQGRFRYFGAQGVIDHIDQFIFDGEYLLVAEDGENLRTRKQPIAFKVGGKFWVNNHAHIIKGKTDQTTNDFLLHLLNHISLDAYITGAAQPKLSQGNLLQIKVIIPTLPIQKKIAGVLSAYDDLIEANSKRIKLLEEMAQITYEEWFVRLRFPGHETTHTIAETGLPEGWTERQLDTIGFVNKETISTRNAPKSIHYIDISSADHGRYSPPQEMAFTEAPSRARRIVKFGDTIFSTVRPNRRVYSLILEHDPLLVASTGFAVVTPHQPHNFPFIYLSIDQQSFTEKAVAVAGGAAYPAINQTDFERIKIIVPTEMLMKQFSELVGPNFILKASLQRQNALLKEARDLLLPRLMTGLIDIDDYLSRNGSEAAAA